MTEDLVEVPELFDLVECPPRDSCEIDPTTVSYGEEGEPSAKVKPERS